jgi:hypothetical protein
MDASTRVFRSSFLVLWRWTTLYCGVLGALLYFSTWMDGRPVPPDVTTVMALSLGVIFALAVVAFPVYVSAGGIRCYDFYGVYRTIPWDQMHCLRKRNLCGLRYLVIASPVIRAEIWVPLYLSDMPGFVGTVRQYAGDEHVLVAALHDYGG